MKAYLLLLSLFLSACCVPVFAACPVTAVPTGVQLDVCSLAQTFVFDGDQIQSISVIYPAKGDTYTQTFTYDAGEISEISAWTLN